MNTRKNLSLRTFILCFLLINTSCSDENLNDNSKMQENYEVDTEVSSHVVYGSDGRLDLYEVEDANLKRLADSTVALIKKADMTSQSGITTIRSKNYGTQMGLCSSEKYYEQDIAAFCSGFLVAPDVIVTAGHCIKSQSDCIGTQFVFGFNVKAAGLFPQQVSESEVYNCREIIKTTIESNGTDFAVIKLDRAVTNHRSLAVRQNGSVQVGDPLVVVGHPAGLRTKVTLGGKVRTTAAETPFFVANVDTYGGNSGSVVFNADTGLVEGILVRGEQDFTPKNGCYISKVCAEDTCRGEDITRIAVVKSFIPDGEQPVPDTPVTKPEVFTSNEVLNIPDRSTVGIKSVLNVTSSPNGRKVSLSLNIAHTFIGDLVVRLTTPEGKIVSIHSKTGGSEDNIIKTYDLTAALKSVQIAGEYKLTVQDLVARDIGSLKSWSLRFE